MIASLLRTNPRRGFFAPVLTLATFMAILTGPTNLLGQAPTAAPTVVRIEEDWSLRVSQPLYNLSCPQVSTQMAPSPCSTQFYQFHLNSQDVPQFVQGGLQLQAWNGNSVLAVKTGTNTATMGTAIEPFRFVTRSP